MSSTKEAATQLNISYNIVIDHLNQISRKPHARSRIEAVLRFLEAGDE